jgi:hypothetical protein
MNNEELVEDRRAFWRFKHAQQCFDHAARTSTYVLNEGWSQDHPLIYPISVAIVVLYARPFSNCFGIGKLDEKIVPRSSLSRHRKLLLMRHKVFAHHDTVDFEEPSIAQLRPGVRLNLQGKQAAFEISEITLLDVSLGQILELSNILNKKCSWYLEKLIHKHKKRLPKISGIYNLDLDESSDDFFSKKATD